MDQQEQDSDNLIDMQDQFQQDKKNIEQLDILKPVFEVGHLYENYDHKICKVLFNKLNYDQIIGQGIELYQGDIFQNKQQALLNKQSIPNSGIIQYINQGQLPAYYNHQNWICTLQNILLTLQEDRQLMNWETALWISKSIAQVIELQHQQNIFLLNTSIASVVFRNDFNFSLIQFCQNGSKLDYYKFILLNFSDTTEQELKKPTKEKLEFLINKKHNSSDSKNILEQGANILVDIPADIPAEKRLDTSSDVQIFIYQLRKHVEKYNQNQSTKYSIENINFDILKRHLTVKITDFDCAQSQNKNPALQIIYKIPLKQRHPNILEPNFNLLQQDYFSLGIIMYWIFNHTQAQLKFNQIPPNEKEFKYYLQQKVEMNKSGLLIDFNINDLLEQIKRRNPIPEEFQGKFISILGLLSKDLEKQKQAFQNVLNLIN
ncbi:hypothetical protein pb186bvf_005289 [Paramecium bursaria]